MTKRLHYFNPGHEIALFQGKKNFTPPANVLKMMKDLSCLPAWYAEEGDFILSDSLSERYLLTLPTALQPLVELVTPTLLKEKKNDLPELVATPWGISRHSLEQMERLKKETGISLQVPEWKEQYYTLTSRKTAATCLTSIRQKLSGTILPEIPRFFTSTEELEDYLSGQNTPNLIKTPYSSSGRGLLWLTDNILTKKEKEWINGAIHKQGCVSLEPALNKISDYGWEFLTDGKGNIEYRGISPFTTNPKGSFLGNSIYPQDKILQDIYQLITPEEYNRILATTTRVLQDTYSHIYEGCIGVDILIYQTSEGTYHLHPCVEVNMRYTMGYLSLQLEKIIHPESKGTFQLTYDNNGQSCYQTHLEMQKQHPLKITDNKIREGYLSLCPVNVDTNYKAFILVE